MSVRSDRIKILNPLGSFDTVSPDAAIGMILKGLAVPSPNVPNAILMISNSAGHAGVTSAKPVIRDSKSGYDRCANQGLATLKSLQHFPVMMPLDLFVLPTRKTVRILHPNSGALGRGIDLCDGFVPRQKEPKAGLYAAESQAA